MSEKILSMTPEEAYEAGYTAGSMRDWTPCAEGLPTVKETVLATIADGFGNDIMFAWYDGENWKDGYKNKIPVIAWQHLPTQYRADDTTGKVKEDEFMREAMYDQLHSNGN